MKIYFYQANFCAECGNEMKPRFSWGPRYFCDECAARMGRGIQVKTVLGLVLASTLVAAALHRADPPRALPAPPAAASVSAHDATAVQVPVLKAAPASNRVLCGARTKKGTPCKHLAPPGERCPQHRGLPSILTRPETGAR